MNLKSAFVLLTLVGGISLAATSTHAAAGASVDHYYFFKQRRDLPLETTRVAVRMKKGDRTGLNTALRRTGFAESGVAEFAIPDWVTAELPGGERSAERVMQRVTELASDDAIEFASPIFVGIDGGPVIVTADLLIGFNEDVGDDAAGSILSNLGDIVDRHWTGMRGVYRVRSKSRNGAGVLAAANRMAERADVRFAEPDMIFTGRAELIPNDPFFSSCWGLHNTGQSGGTPNMDMDGPEA